MILRIPFAALLLIGSQCLAQEPLFVWARALACDGFISTPQISATSDGGSLLLVNFTGTLTIGDTTLSSLEQDVLVIRSGSGGELLWYATAQGPGSTGGSSISVDATDAAYVGGHFENSIQLGGLAASGSGAGSAFIARLGADGTWLWIKHGEGPIGASCSTVACASDGTLRCVGHSSTPLVFNGDTLVPDTGGVMFVASLDSTGIIQWSNYATSQGSIPTFDLLTTPDGSAIISFAALGTVICSTDTFSAGREYVIAELSASGAWESFDEIVIPAWTGYSLLRLARTSTNELYAVGCFSDSTIVGGIALPDTSVNDIFIAKRQSDGVWSWAQTIGNNFTEKNLHLLLDEQEQPVILGAVIHGFDNGNTYLLANGVEDIFYGSLNSNGDWLVFQNIGGSGGEYATTCARSSDSGFLVAGNFWSSALLPPFEFQQSGTWDNIFYGRLDPVTAGINPVPDPPLGHIHVHPNPSTGSVTVDIQTWSVLPELLVLDCLGQVVIRTGGESGLHDLNLGPLAPGLFTIRCGNSVARIVKE